MCLEVLVPRGGMSLRGNSRSATNLEVWLTSGLSRFLLPRNQQKRVTILAGEIRPDPQEKVGLLLDSEHREDYVQRSHTQLQRYMDKYISHG